MQELREQSQVVLAGGEPACRVFPEPCAFNVFNHESPVEPDTGLNGEERKIIDETRRIWNDFNLPITPTCVRVPVMRAHSQAITVRLERSASQQELREALRQGRGICLVDDPAGTRFPTPLQASGRDDVLVGRVRPDPAEPISASGTSRSWCLFLSGDQLRKGAALNALQIASLITCGQTAVEPPRIARSPVARGC
jgi:aspartate-semialdehyde dehydrogenase